MSGRLQSLTVADLAVFALCFQPVRRSASRRSAPPASHHAPDAERALPEREVSLATLTCLALIVGIVAGLGAIFFKFLIAVISNFAFYGEISAHFDPNAYGPPSPWGPLIIAVPVIGGLIVVFLVRNFAPEAKGHGVPEVIYAIYHQRGDVRGIVAVVKSLASAIAIGTKVHIENCKRQINEFCGTQPNDYYIFILYDWTSGATTVETYQTRWVTAELFDVSATFCV